MGRFINLGIAIVNTSYIIRVEMESDGRAEIYMSDGISPNGEATIVLGK